MDSLLEGIFHGMICGWILMTSMWRHWNDFLSEKPSPNGFVSVIFRRVHYSISAGNMPHYIPIIPIIFSQKYQHDICFALAWHTRPEVVANQRLEVRPDFLGWEPERANGCNEERTAVACFFDVLSLISLGTRWCPIFREVREHNWRFPKNGVAPNHTSHLTILLSNP